MVADEAASSRTVQQLQQEQALDEAKRDQQNANTAREGRKTAKESVPREVQQLILDGSPTKRPSYDEIERSPRWCACSYVLTFCALSQP